jgi:predicted nucleotide-binding protein
VHKEKWYRDTRFTPETIREAWAVLERAVEKKDRAYERSYLTAAARGATWTHDSEDEFFADYRSSKGNATFEKTIGRFSLRLQVVDSNTNINVAAPDRATIEATFEIFERDHQSARLPEPPPEPPPEITIFIGHGRSPIWKELKDHLHEKHGYAVVAYEIGARAGHTIRDVLEDMMKDSSLAVLVMTGEDELADGRLHPRLNVVHEAGLFQGHLGFSRAVILLEEGAEEFSNIQGVQQIRFARGNIKETFGDVLATIRREFPDDTA